MSAFPIDLTVSGAASARRLIAAVLAAAKANGIDQATLAKQAGISAESLSRLKKAGGCRLETLLALARAAGFTALELAARADPRIAASLAATKLSAGRRLAIAAGDLVRALRGGEVRAEQRAHLCGFFEELPVELVHDVVLDEGLDYANLAALARRLGAEGEIVDWLQEMAGDFVAHAA